MPCKRDVMGFEVWLPWDNCEPLDELLNIYYEGEGDCRKALLALNTLRRMASVGGSPLLLAVTSLDKALAVAIREGGCRDSSTAEEG